MPSDNPFRILGSMEIDAALIASLVKNLRFEKNTHGLLQGIRAAAERLRNRAGELIQQQHGAEDETHD